MQAPTLENETFRHGGDPVSCSGVTANNCSFNQCNVRASRWGWNRFSNLALRDAAHWNCSISGAAFESVTLHNMKRVGRSPLFIWASVFEKVKLSGRIAGLKINRSLDGLQDPEQAGRDRKVVAYYASVDWAIDISQAHFPGGVTFEAIPGDKVIRNPATQKLVRRDKIAGRDWRSLDFDDTAIDIAISWFESGSLFDSVVLVGSCDPKYAARDQKVLEMLQAEGVAERD